MMSMFLLLRGAALAALLCAVIAGSAAADRPVPPKAPPTCRSVSDSAAAAAGSLPRCQTGFTYLDRSAAVQRIMRLMYGNNGRYHTLSALVVDRVPGDTSGSVRFFIRQPDTARAAIYSNLSATGRPIEITSITSATTERYSPANGTFTQIDRLSIPTTFPPLATLPLGVPQRDEGATSLIDADMGAGPLALANALVHPSDLITGPTFTADHVVVDGNSTVGGRRCWVLAGSPPSTRRPAPSHVRAWHMCVDTRSGIVLRMLFTSQGRVTGSAEMRQIRIDGAAVFGGGDDLAHWSLPVGARYLSPAEYTDSTTAGGSSPVSWLRDHPDTSIGLVILLVLLVIRWAVGRVEKGERRKSTQHIRTE